MRRVPPFLKKTRALPGSRAGLSCRVRGPPRRPPFFRCSASLVLSQSSSSGSNSSLDHRALSLPTRGACRQPPDQQVVGDPVLLPRLPCGAAMPVPLNGLRRLTRLGNRRTRILNLGWASSTSRRTLTTRSLTRSMTWSGRPAAVGRVRVRCGGVGLQQLSKRDTATRNRRSKRPPWTVGVAASGSSPVHSAGDNLQQHTVLAVGATTCLSAQKALMRMQSPARSASPLHLQILSHRGTSGGHSSNRRVLGAPRLRARALISSSAPLPCNRYPRRQPPCDHCSAFPSLVHWPTSLCPLVLLMSRLDDQRLPVAAAASARAVSQMAWLVEASEKAAVGMLRNLPCSTAAAPHLLLRAAAEPPCCRCLASPGPPCRSARRVQSLAIGPPHLALEPRLAACARLLWPHMCVVAPALQGWVRTRLLLRRVGRYREARGAKNRAHLSPPRNKAAPRAAVRELQRRLACPLLLRLPAVADRPACLLLETCRHSNARSEASRPR